VSNPSVSTILRDYVRLSIHSFDRLYLNGYVPTLQTPGQLVAFCRDHLGAPLPSPALFGPLRERFIAAVRLLVQQQDIPLVPFQRKQRKDDVAAWHRARFTAKDGVVFVGVAQEKASSFKATKRVGTHGQVSFDFARQPVAVNHYYFYLQDREWGRPSSRWAATCPTRCGSV